MISNLYYNFWWFPISLRLLSRWIRLASWSDSLGARSRCFLLDHVQSSSWISIFCKLYSQYIWPNFDYIHVIFHTTTDSSLGHLLPLPILPTETILTVHLDILNMRSKIANFNTNLTLCALCQGRCKRSWERRVDLASAETLPKPTMQVSKVVEQTSQRE